MTAAADTKSRYQSLFDWFSANPHTIASVADVRRALPDLCDESLFACLLGQCVRDHKFLTQPSRGFYQFRRCSERPVSKGWAPETRAALSEKKAADEFDRRVVHLTPGAAPVAIDPILSAPLVRRVDRCAHR